MPASLTGPLVPQLATLAAEAPTGEQWLHEIKHDGYRLLAYIDSGRVVLRTRRGLDWTHRFSELADSLRELPVSQTVLDGEVVALLPSGASSFQELQAALSEGRTRALVYYAFDLLYLDGYDLRGVPLERRKALLAEIVREAGQRRVLYSEHLVGEGQEFFAQCCRMGLEGIISKRRDGPHHGGRSADWLKVKCVQSGDFVIGGFADSTAARRPIANLLLGERDEAGRLVYAGRVGTGFSDRTLRELRGRLGRLEQRECPFVRQPSPREVGRLVHWVRPELVAQVRYVERTRDGVLRLPCFLGLREDL